MFNKKFVVKTILSFILAAVFLVSASTSIQGPEIWIYATIIGVALIGYTVYSFVSDKPGTEES
ncbi:MAG: hypothetical protein J5770_02585 [Bacteroidaceae bacterium]|nr:hypothetical protein [Bacteroidaceae bacterium]